MDARWLRVAGIVVAVCVAGGEISRTEAALTPAQKKELAAIRSVLARIHTPVRHDAIDATEQKVSDAEQRLEAVMKDAGLPAEDSHIASIRKMIASRRQAIEKAREKEAKKNLSGGEHVTKKKSTKEKGSEKGTSFATQVAPIFVQRCVSCHGKDAKGGLRLDTFAGMERGGKSGPLLVIGEAENSLIMARLVAQDTTRMPKGGEPLSETECMTIAEWIARGAKFDGDDPNKSLDKVKPLEKTAMPLEKLAAPADRPQTKVPVKAKVVIARPTGNETVSFTKDIAPFMVERCLRCHSGNDPKGGLSLETFESLLAGGKTGSEITPGDLAKSRLWDLVGEQKPFKMPPGDAFIRRAHWNSLRTWIQEGAKFDGPDPKQPLKSLVPSETERQKAELARTSPEEFREKRKRRSEELWRRAVPKDSPELVENDAFLVFGNVPAERLQEVARWAAAAVQTAGAFFDDRSTPAFKGGLAIFVMKDRFSYEEFCQAVEKREPQPAIRGHAVVTPDLKDAYVVVQNHSDETTDSVPSMQTDVTELVATAFVMRSDRKLPEWLVAGSGRILASSKPASVVSKTQWPQVYRLVGSLEKPEDLLTDGTFSPSAARDVGAALVASLLESRGKSLFVRFVRSLQSGTSQADALRDVYGADVRGTAEAFLTRAAQAARKAGN